MRKQLVQLAVYLALIALVFFSDYLPLHWSDPIEKTEGGWIVVGSLLMVCCFLLAVNYSHRLKLGQGCDQQGTIASPTPLLLIAMVALLTVATHAFDGSVSSQLFRCTLLVGGLVVGQIILLFWTRISENELDDSICLFLLLFSVCLSIAPFLTNEKARFMYGGQKRWAGPCENPNTFGLLMAIGLLLIIGQVAFGLKPACIRKFFEPHSEHGAARNRSNKGYILFLMLLGSIILVALLKSYSRGAWLAAFAGMVVLVRGNQASFVPAWFRGFWRNAVPLLVCLAATAALGFGEIRNVQSATARRVTSVSNVNDFSWRNRLSSGMGALQMLAEKPTFGHGRYEPDQMYTHFYRTGSRTSSDTSILLNDYSVMGISFGLIAVTTFAGWQFVALRPKKRSSVSTEEGRMAFTDGAVQSGSLVLLAKAVTIAMLVAFLFDGGLFKIPTAATFAVFSVMLLLPVRLGLKAEMLERAVTPV